MDRARVRALLGPSPGEDRLAAKGVVRSGEAYCLACHQMVEREATKCQACLSELTEEVKAFGCPKCQTVLALGDPLCPTCGMKFKVKALKPKEPAKDDQFLMKLIEWGKGPGERPVQPQQEPTPPATVQPAPPEASDERMRNLARLRESISDLMENRSQMLERMQKRIDEDKARLAGISST